ncbi:MAG: cytochrome c, partial [Polynucleobacter sp.]
MLAASIILITASPAFAQFQKTEDAIKYRQSAFSLIGTHFGRIGAVVKGEVP